MNTKSEIRTEILARRDALGGEKRIDKSLLAAELGGDDILFDPGCIISGFFPIRSEIDPRPLMDKLRQRGAMLCLPVVVGKTKIIFRELVRGAELIDTGFGTRGPGSDARVVDPQIMLMPLAAFDETGGRIGYGAGHYDRAIARLVEMDCRPRLFGVAFDCQQCEHVPQERHDIAMDAIVTESGFREFVK
ncbi:MAG: 5-formyltetrahydrofolate cyclo-ligase [Rhizobiaceae bacterium]|nr:5-formyltetrahydrofolate cyclo-ligase [Rhizobiaceae bacterium]